MRPSSSEPALDLWNVYIPLDRQQRSNRTFGLMMIRRPGMRVTTYWLDVNEYGQQTATATHRTARRSCVTTRTRRWPPFGALAAFSW